MTESLLPGNAKRVLLVGEGFENFRDSASRGIQPLTWNLCWVRSGLRGLHLLGESHFDAVVAKVQLSDMQGMQFLDEVMRRQPCCMRFLASDLDKLKALASSGIGTIHQLITDTLDWPCLQQVLHRAAQPDPWSPTESAQNVLSRFRYLPSPPTLYFRVVEALESEEACLERVAELVSQDMAMTAKLLQVVNSALFGLNVQLADASEAVLYLGVETTKALLLLAHTFSYFDELKSTGHSMEELWQHSFLTGQYAQSIAEAEGVEGPELSLSYTAGMLHDLGKLALAANLPDLYARMITMAKQENLLFWQAEQAVFGVTHGEIGACLLRIWRLPEDLIEAVALHHFPSQLLNRQFAPITAVHVANVLAHELQPGECKQTPAVDFDYLAGLGLSLRLEEWRELCQQPSEV